MSVAVLANVPAIARDVFDYCEARDRVLALVKQGLGFIDQAREISNEHVPYGFSLEIRESYEGFRTKLDGRYWQFALDRTGAAAVMDAEARKQFRAQLEKGDVPEFTPDNVTTHFLSMSQEADMMFARGVYNVFRHYARMARHGYETNKREPFKIPRKLILSGWFSTSWRTGLHVNYYRSDEVNDFGRIVNVLAGRPYLPRGFETELNAVLDKSDTFENAILKVRGFRNGNAHLWIKDRVLLDAINAQIAKYCDGQLPDVSENSSRR